MNTRLDRRTFLRLASASAALLAQEARPQAASQATAQAAAQAATASATQRIQPTPHGPRAAVKSRKNFVGIQVRGFAWVDEGIDQVLDNIQKKGGVNTVWAYTFAYGEQRLRTGGGLPDHGTALTAANTGVNAGALYDYDLKYFQKTSVKDFRLTGYGKFNVIEQVASKAHARGMDFFAWDLNNPSPTLARNSAAYAALGEVDLTGRKTTNPCFNNPDFRTYLSGKIESLLSGYASEVDGVAWGCEREGPLDSLVTGGGNATCFCPFCQAKAKGLGISVERAQAGYKEIGQLFRATPDAVPGRLLHLLLAIAAEVSRSPELGVAVDGQLPGGAGRAVRAGQVDCAAEALRLSLDAGHDLQPVLSRRRGLYEAQGIRGLPEAGDV